MSPPRKTDPNKRSSADLSPTKNDVGTANATDKDATPSPRPRILKLKLRKQLRTIPSTTYLGNYRAATASPETHVGDRTATRKALRRDLVIGNTDNVAKPTL